MLPKYAPHSPQLIKLFPIHSPHKTSITMNTSTPHPFIKWFADITIADVPLVGGKNALPGESIRQA